MSLHLPDDIVLQIIKIIREDLSDTPSLRNLRLVSKRVGSLASLILFSKCRFLPPSRPRAIHLSDITSSLINGETKVFQNVTKADIWLRRGVLQVEEAPPWGELLNLLIPAMTNLRSVYWMFTPCKQYPPQLISSFIRNLGSLGTIKELSILFTLYGVGDDFSLEPLSDIHSLSIKWQVAKRMTGNPICQISKLIARSPDLESFIFTIPNPCNSDPDFGEQMTLGEFFVEIPSSLVLSKLRRLEVRGIIVTANDFNLHFRHFRYLRRLRIKADPGPSPSSQFGEICGLLQREGVRVTNFSTDSIDHPNVLEYLSSYSGIEHLVLKPSPWHIPHDFPQLVDQFFGSVLPNHSHSLKSLKLGGNKVTRWSGALSGENIKALEECRLLQDLCCWLTVSPEDAAGGNGQLLINRLEAARRLLRLQRFRIKLVLFRRLFHNQGYMMHYTTEPDPDPAIAQFVKQVVIDYRRRNDLNFVITWTLEPGVTTVI